MKIAIDARKLHDFGIGTYIRNLLRHLARIDRQNEYVLLCQEADMGVAATLGENFRGVLEPSNNYSVSEQIHVPWVLMREKPDVYHAPHYVLPVAVRSRSVVTIHDCIHLMFPQYLPNRAAYAYARGAMWSAARHSDRILTVSEASKRDILHFFNVAPEKISVVYNAIDERFWVEPAAEDIARVRERFQLDQRFVLYAGTIKPHKNLVRLIEAFAELRRGGFEELKLLIIGDEISKLPALRRAHGRIVFISSESAINVPVEMVHYGMTKTAQLAVARGLAELTAATGVTVNSVLPGPTRSEGVERFVEDMSTDGSADGMLLFDFPRVDALVNVGGAQESLVLPAMERVVGADDLAPRLRGESRATYGTLCGAIEQIGATRVMAEVR